MAADTALEPKLGRNPSMATLILVAAVSPLAINMFVPSMPGLAVAFDAPYAKVQLGLSLYMAATAMLTLGAGPLSDRYGRRPVLLGGMVLFILGTLMILFAPDLNWFLAGRVLQSGSAAGIVLSRVVVRDLVDRERAASAIGYVTMGMAVAPMIGPAIGGVLDEHFGWQASFIMLLAVGAIALGAALANLPETKPADPPSQGGQLGRYGRLLANPLYLLFVASGSSASAVFFGFLGGGPAIANGLLGLSASQYGLWFAATAAGYMLGNFLSGRHAMRVGVPRMIVLGAVTTLTGTLIPVLLFSSGIATALALFGPMFLVGVGNGLTLPSATSGAISVDPAASGVASGLLGSIQIGLGAGISVLCAWLVGDGHMIMPFALAMAAFAAASLVFCLAVGALTRRKLPATSI